ncbi:hypothetical protein C4F51_01905 [Cellvibrio sp. KB43]|uniref:PEGA domain-containing protein n=1 Tax=Cellvibrio polysaccharolyticus TaxID=2082724 RepID=A0A928V0A3_9GAMM|nr:hypothetical protein [Cellvibrio polysaccharolyticus]
MVLLRKNNPQKINLQTAAELSAEGFSKMSRLVVRRTKALWQDRVRDYTIFVDGNEVGRIGNDTKAIIQVEPGAHTVCLKIDWCHSPEVKVLISPGETVHLECGPNANPFLVLFYIAFWKDKYIWLRQAHGSIL